MPTYNKGYKDLSFDFEANPVTGDVGTVKDTNSVKRGIQSLLMTENRERLFNPELGSGVKNLLFEAWEDRADLLDIAITAEPDYNRYRVAVIFRLINQVEENTLEVFLTRER